MQEISHTIFVQPPICSQILVAHLNESAIAEYLVLYNKTVFPESDRSPLSIEFQSDVKVSGNVFGEHNLITTLQILSGDAISGVNNAEIKLDGTIVFKEHLLANHMHMNLNTDNFGRLSNVLGSTIGNRIQKNFTNSVITFKDIIVSSSNFNSLKIHRLNAHTSFRNNLSSIQNDGTPQISTMIFEKQMKAASVTWNMDSHFFDKSRHFDFDNILLDLLNMQIHRIRSLIINGNCTFVVRSLNENIQINTLNELNFVKYMRGVISKQQKNRQKTVEISGEKALISDVNALSVHTVEFNKHFQIRDWFNDSFRRQRTETKVQQVILSSGWQLADVLTDNLKVQTSINAIEIFPGDKKSANIIFVDDNPTNIITIVSDISLSNYAKISADSQLNSIEFRPCIVHSLAPETVYLPQISWYELNIIGNVKVLSSKTEKCGLYCFFQKTMSAKLDEKIDISNTFKLECREKFSFNRILLSNNSSLNKQNVYNMINNIDLSNIFLDSVMPTLTYADWHKQSINFQSQKEFNGVKVASNGWEANLSQEFLVESINDVIVKDFKESLFYRNSKEILILPRQRLLFLQAPITKAININKQETINGVALIDLCFVYTKRKNLSCSLSFQYPTVSSKS